LSGRTFCTSSSRADTARTRRRCIRPALAAAYAPRARRAAGARHDTTRGLGTGRVVVVTSGRGRRALCGAAPPTSSPLRVPIRQAPPGDDRWQYLSPWQAGAVRRGQTDRE
jgi:hypothetical protein